MKQAETSEIRRLLRALCEAETDSGDEMICHDGGFHYGGDFATMDHALIEPAAILSDEDYVKFRSAGYIEEIDPRAGRAGGFRVTREGRDIAYGHRAP